MIQPQTSRRHYRRDGSGAERDPRDHESHHAPAFQWAGLSVKPTRIQKTAGAGLAQRCANP